jgi:predicted nucleic acid-binding protein
VSPFLLREYRSVLRHLRFRVSSSRIAGWIDRIEQRATLVRPTRPIHALSPDPDDAHVLACAVTADADYLVTNDVGHFPSAPVGRTVIAKPSAMRRTLAEADIV